MNELFKFLKTYEIWGYVILSVIAFFYFQKLVQAWNDWRLAMYGLEREAAQRRVSTAATVLVLLILIGVVQFTLVSFLGPSYPWSGNLPTPTLDFFITPTPTLEGISLTPVSLSDENGATDGSSMMEATPPSSDGCVAGQIEWTYPTTGQEIKGIVELSGTVNVTDLGFYKYEYSQAGSDNWLTIAAGNEIKIDEPLGGAWNTTQLIPGDYLLRLVIADKQNQMLPPCVIPITITYQ